MKNPFSKKAKSYIEATYPPKKLTDPALIKVVPNELDKLIKYVVFNPTQLAHIGEFIEKRVKKDIAKLRPAYVEVSLEIVDTILKECQANLLGLFFPHVIRILMECLQPKGAITNLKPEDAARLKIHAAMTFVRFAKKGSSSIKYQDLSAFVSYFAVMGTFESKDSKAKELMRRHGLLGLSTFIEAVDDLDNFVANFMDASNKEKDLMPVVLDNMSEFESKSSQEEPDNDGIGNLCSEILKELTISSSPITIQTLVSSILSHLHQKPALQTDSFQQAIFRAISSKPQQHTLIVSQLLIYLETVPDMDYKQRILKIVTYLFEQVIQNQVGAFIEIIIPILNQFGASKNEAEADSLSEHIPKLVGLISQKVQDGSEQMAAVVYILNNKVITTKANNEKVFLLKCLASITEKLNPLPANKDIPQKILDLLLPLTSSERDPSIRSLAMQTIFHLLQVAKGEDVPENDIRKRDQNISRSVFQNFFKDSNEPPVYSAIFDIFNLYLTRYGRKGLQYSLPIFFKAEEMVKTDNCPPHIISAAHTLIAAYFIQVAKLINVPALEDSVYDTMGGRDTKDSTSSWCSSFNLKSGFTNRKKKFKKAQKIVNTPLQKFFDKEKILTLISLDPNVAKEVPDWKEKYSQELDSDFLSGRLRSSSYEVNIEGEGLTTPTPKLTARLDEEQQTKPERRNTERIEKVNAQTFLKILGLREEESSSKLSESSTPVFNLANSTYDELLKTKVKQAKERKTQFFQVLESTQDSSYPSQSTLKLQFPSLPHATHID